MVTSPSGLPATGISGSCNTDASVSTLSSSASARADRGSADAPSTAEPAPSSASASRRLVAGFGRADGVNWFISSLPANVGTCCPNYVPLQRQVTDQHINRHGDDDRSE